MTEIIVYSLSVCIKTKDARFKENIDRFIAAFYTVKGHAHNPNVPPEVTEYVSRIAGGAVLMHTNQFLHLIHYLKEIGSGIPGNAVRVDMPSYDYAVENYKVRDEWTLFPKQVPAYEFIINNPVKSKMVNIPTGGGKTATSMIALAHLRMRIGLCILPMYIEDKWVKDIVKIHDTKSSKIMVISGSKAIRSIVAMAKDNELTSAEYYIVSSRTMQDFIAAYEENPDACVFKYGISPFELFPLLKIGVLMVDETHQHFHAIFKVILYCNVIFQLGLSATLISDDSVVSRVHKIVYPDKQVYTQGELPKYIDVYALGYYIPEGLLRQVKTTNFGSNSYAHAAFENSMVKNKPLLKFYLHLITANLEAMFIDQYEAGDVCLIFVSTVKFATMLTEIYRKLLPHLRVNRYCEDDPGEHLEESDLIISTVISSGTAVDIANLRVVLQTVNISSTPQNIQNLGRLRELKGGKDTRFAYLYAENIRKQRMYHEKRKEIFAPRCASHRMFRAKTQSTLKLPV